MQLQSLQSLQCYQCLKKILVTFKFVGSIHCRCDVQSVIHAFTVSRLHQVVNSTVAVFPYSVYCCTNFADDAQRLAVDFYPCSYYTEFFASRGERCICVTIHHMEYIVVNKRNIIIGKVFHRWLQDRMSMYCIFFLFVVVCNKYLQNAHCRRRFNCRCT